MRPLGVGEILDGAVTTIRKNPGSMLGLSAIVAAIVQLLGFGLTLFLIRDLDRLATLPDTATVGEIFSITAGTFGAGGVTLVVGWLATVILTGILTVVVSRAVLGERLSAGAAWRRARPRLPRLFALTFLYTLIWASPLLVLVLASVALAAAGAPGWMIAIVVLLGLAAGVVTVWLYVRYALAVPALMLESTPATGTSAGTSAHHDGGSRPIGVIMALRRSAELVRRSWWRVFGILLLVSLISSVISQVLAVPFSIPYLLSIDPAGQPGVGALAVAALGGIIATTITAPFVAAAVALLYVDRRIRGEALDIELARAAGVTIPGRTDQHGPPRAP